MSSFEQTSKYVPMDSVALGKRQDSGSELTPRENAFREQCDITSSIIAGKRVPGLRSENPALYDALGTDWRNIRLEIARSHDIRKQTVDPLLNSAAQAIDAYLDSLEEASQEVTRREKQFTRLMEKLSYKAEFKATGVIDLKIRSRDIYNHALNNEKRNNPTASKKNQESNAVNASTWQKELRLRGLKEHLKPDTLSFYYHYQERTVPEVAEKLTDDFKRQLTQDIPQLTEKTKDRCVKERSARTGWTWTQEDRDKSWQVNWPLSEKFFSALSGKNREKLAADSAPRVCSMFQESLRDILKAKERNGSLDVGSIGNLFVDLQFDPAGLEIAEPSSCCCLTFGATQYKLTQDSIYFKLKANDDLLCGLDPLTPINLSSIVDITDAQYDRNL